MKRISIGILAAASLALGAAGCSSTQNSFSPDAVTKSPAVVAPCEKIGGSRPSPARSTNGRDDAADARARSKGANTVLVANDNADKGTAYRCAEPSTAAAADTGS